MEISTHSVKHWRRSHPYTSVAAVYFLIMLVPFCTRQHSSEWDDVFVHAGRTIVQGGEMYTPGDSYLYPPFMAWLAIPFGLLPVGLERLLFYGLNVACAIFLCRWSWSLAGGQPLQVAGTPRSEHLICILGLICAFPYIGSALDHQQVDIIIGCLVMAGCLALSKSRSWIGATAFGLAAAMKCTSLLWCPYLIWRRRWLAAVWLVIVAIGANMLPDLVTPSPSGKPWAVGWLSRYIIPLSDANAYPGSWGSAIIYNQSVCGLWNRYLLTRFVRYSDGFDVVARTHLVSAGTLKLVVYGSEGALVLAALAVCGWWRRRPSLDKTVERSLQEPLEFSIVLALMLLLSPMSSKPHFCILLLPSYCLARAALVRKSRPALILLSLAIFMRILPLRGIWGDELSTFCLWWGCITWSTLLLCVGCLWELNALRKQRWTLNVQRSTFNVQRPTFKVDRRPTLNVGH